MTRILLFSSEPVFAEGLSSLLASTNDFQLAAICDQTDKLPGLIAIQKPDIVLLDVTDDVSFQMIESLRRQAPDCRMLLWINDIPTELARQAMALGIRGVLEKTLPLEMILEALGNVRDGLLWFDKALSDNLLAARKTPLTKRESQLVTMLSQGLKNKEIATMLCVSENTIKVYLSRLFQKVGVKDRFELALYGLRNVVASPHGVDRPVLAREDQRDKTRLV